MVTGVESVPGTPHTERAVWVPASQENSHLQADLCSPWVAAVPAPFTSPLSPWSSILGELSHSTQAGIHSGELRDFSFCAGDRDHTEAGLISGASPRNCCCCVTELLETGLSLCRWVPRSWSRGMSLKSLLEALLTPGMLLAHSPL